jgi:dihydroflavonol-4-reductase
METASRLTQTAPLMQTSDIAMFYGVKQDFDISKAERDLGYAPKPPSEAVREALEYLRANPQLLASS